MPKEDPRIDAYIAQAAPFAKPILVHFRGIVHDACPDVVETMKWSMPHFDHEGIMCSMAAFKEHCRIGFWKGALLDAVSGLQTVEEGGPAMFAHLTSIKDLPSKTVLTRLVKQAARLNEDGVKPAQRPRPTRGEVEVPDDLMQALKKNKKAMTAFTAFPPSHRREYAEWIASAKREETRQRRVETAIAQIAEGKPQNWKYMK